MAQPEYAETAPRLTAVQWLICVISAVGFAFDTYALLVAPLIVRPALMEMAHLRPGMPQFERWVGRIVRRHPSGDRTGKSRRGRSQSR